MASGTPIGIVCCPFAFLTIATRLGVDAEQAEPQARELATVTAMDELARNLQHKLPDS
ncbi:protein of unknown function [Rhodovastum atsumiense]|uniref:hypothetical protein n=1 Tax=Rhodovastum atsumiense TaxID=504468 RepID=UPI00139F2B4A|nr:hypothetical protein [Rhodovastum atsumiense]CAH2599060.1 protein of unknown function [Rhodovastum atsumiense]